MSDPKGDKQIQELLLIRLGLEEKSQRIFKELLKGDAYDPLDDILKNMMSKNQEIKNLKKQLLQAKDEVNKLQKQLGIDPKNTKTLSENRSMSLPPTHQSDMQNIEGKKKEAEVLKTQYRNNIEKYIIFLIKCIREVSKSKFQTTGDVERLINNLQRSLQRERDRVTELTEGMQRNKANFDTFSLTSSSTQSSRKPQQNLDALVNQLRKTQSSQETFQKISNALGLGDMWTAYIDKLKNESQMYHYLKNLMFNKNTFKSTNINDIKREIGQGKKTLWEQKLQKISDEARLMTSVPSLQAKVNEIFVGERKSLEEIPNKTQNLLKQIFNYFFSKLDEMFMKHNQHPYKISNKPNFMNFQKNISELLANNLWADAQNCIKTQINECFYYIERRTKFLSANRMILRNQS